MVSGGDDETETDEPLDNPNNFSDPYLMNYRHSLPGYGKRHQPKGDFSFGEGELDSISIEYNNGFIMNNDWSLPKEAFPLRHEIQNRSPPPEQFPNLVPDVNEDAASILIEDQPCQLVVTCVPRPIFWDPTTMVEDTLKYHANIKDIQTAASILLALGDKRKNLNIELAMQEHWLLEYIDILGRFKLWEVSSRVRTLFC